MISKEQEKWLNQFTGRNLVKIVPYDETAPLKFEHIKEIIQQKLGQIEVVHMGASSMGISGQGELDIYIPVNEETFNQTTTLLKEMLGEPGSVYPLERVRFVTYIDGTKAEIFVINNQSRGWLDGLRFESALRNDPELLDDYRKLKEKGNGLSTKEYYRQKIEFINKVLGLG